MADVLKTWNKPNWLPELDLVATKSGWCNKKNHNEVLVAVGYLDDKILAQTPVVPEEEEKEKE